MCVHCSSSPNAQNTRKLCASPPLCALHSHFLLPVLPLSVLSSLFLDRLLLVPAVSLMRIAMLHILTCSSSLCSLANRPLSLLSLCVSLLSSLSLLLCQLSIRFPSSLPPSLSSILLPQILQPRVVAPNHRGYCHTQAVELSPVRLAQEGRIQARCFL